MKSKVCADQLYSMKLSWNWVKWSIIEKDYNAMCCNLIMPKIRMTGSVLYELPWRPGGASICVQGPVGFRRVNHFCIFWNPHHNSANVCKKTNMKTQDDLSQLLAWVSCESTACFPVLVRFGQSSALRGTMMKTKPVLEGKGVFLSGKALYYLVLCLSGTNSIKARV